MRHITRSMLGERAAGCVLDIGCGPGLDLQDLPAALVGMGMDLEKAPVVPDRFVQADGARAPFADATFDILLLLDVLDNPASEPVRLLPEARRLLRPGGLLFVRVPAYPWLHSPRDDFWGSARRYTRVDLATLVQDCGFTVCRLSYANCLLFAPAAAVRLVMRVAGHGQDELRQPPFAMNSLLRKALSVEAGWLRAHDLPFGLSLICLATPRT